MGAASVETLDNRGLEVQTNDRKAGVTRGLSQRQTDIPKANDDQVEISVSDQGIGIPAGEIDRIFERFYRVDPARHRSTGGTGLGLSIVKHVAATHGGDVRVWSVEGQGSTFTVVLPRWQEEAVA